MSTHEHYEALMMKAVDGFLAKDEEPVWNEHLSECEACATEFAAFAKTHDHTREYRERMLYEFRAMEAQRSGKAAVGLGWFLILGAYVAFAGFSLWVALVDPNVPIWIKGATVAAVCGFGLLFFKVLRDRMRTVKSDKYLEVDR